MNQLLKRIKRALIILAHRYGFRFTDNVDQHSVNKSIKLP